MRMIKRFQHLKQRIRRGGDLRLAMTLLVRNEEDIIADNIRVHSDLGVDCFAVMDNGSNDGTREILEELADHHELQIIDQPAQTYQQREWMTQLARFARKKLGADLVISNDADEFWLPDSGKLTDHLRRTDWLISCPRYNMLLTKDFYSPGYRYYDSTLRAQSPISYDAESQETDDAAKMPLAKISGKVIVNPHGLLRIEAGNFRARHIAGSWRTRKKSDRISVYHYPIRSYEQFERNVKHRHYLVDNNRRIRQGPHYFRWLRLLEQGKLKEEFDRFILKDDEIAALKRFSVVGKDEFPRRLITSILGKYQ